MFYKRNAGGAPLQPLDFDCPNSTSCVSRHVNSEYLLGKGQPQLKNVGNDDETVFQLRGVAEESRGFFVGRCNISAGPVVLRHLCSRGQAFHVEFFHLREILQHLDNRLLEALNFLLKKFKSCQLSCNIEFYPFHVLLQPIEHGYPRDVNPRIISPQTRKKFDLASIRQYIFR